MLKAFQTMYNDDQVRFKSVEQFEATKDALERKSDLLIILPTGGGKTLTYLLPIFMEETLTTVIVLPYVVLVDQVEELCMSMNITSQIWRGKGHSIGNSQAILIAAEHAVQPEFQSLLITLQSTNKLARVVMDECHTAATHKDFREDIRRIGVLGRGGLRVPIHLLSATCTPEMARKLEIIFGCLKLKTIRRIEDRKEIKYSVHNVDKEVKEMKDLYVKIGLFIVDEMEHWKEDDRAIIYCLQKEWANEMCEYFNKDMGHTWCKVYHAKMSHNERQEVLMAWKTGKVKIIIATSALGAGLDYRSVRLVIHHGFAQRLIDFCQESGRGGRDGKRAESVTFYWSEIEEKTKWIKEEGRKEMLEYCKSGMCRKLFMSLYLHGEGKDCLSQSEGLLCDNCERQLETEQEWIPRLPVGQKRKRDEEMTEVEDVIAMKEMIKALQNKCPLCWIRQKESCNHLFDDCE